MFSQIPANFSWLDILLLIVLVRGCVIGFKKGLLIEVFKIAGLIIAGVLAIHFFPVLSKAVVGFSSLLEPVAPIFSYILIIVVGVVVFRLFREGVMVVAKKDDLKPASKIAGAVSGFLRGLLISSLILLGCVITESVALKNTLRHSYATQHLLTISTAIYGGVYDNLIGPFFSGESKNVDLIKKVREYRHRSADI